MQAAEPVEKEVQVEIEAILAERGAPVPPPVEATLEATTAIRAAKKGNYIANYPKILTNVPILG